MYMLSLRDAARSPSPSAKSYLAKSFKDAWMYADHFVPQLKHCWLRNVNKHTHKARQGAPGMGHWLYTLPTGPLTKVANAPFKWGLQHRFGLASPGAGHLCGKQLPGAKQPCKATLAWCARRAREIRHNRLRDFLVEYVKTTGAIATSEQAMPLPRAGSSGSPGSSQNAMARTFGLMSGLAWPNLIATCSRN